MHSHFSKISSITLGCIAGLLFGSAQGASQCSSGACTSRGELLSQRSILALPAPEFATVLGASEAGQQLLQIAGTPRCDVEIVYFVYSTIGGASERTRSSAALMIPSGTNGCSGPRPVLLYAHGTSTYRNFNIADITQADPANVDGAVEGISVAAMYAAQGYIVVASNYAGYSGSDLPYHPYLNADQQSADVIDSLSAAQRAMPKSASGAVTRRDGKLFVTGYSQGGYVALAAHRALQARGVPVTASSPASGPYALAAMADAIFQGNVDLGSTVFTTMVASSYQHAYGNIYQHPQEIFKSPYAHGIGGLLPNVQPLDVLFASGRLPVTTLFSQVPPAPMYAALTPPSASPLTPPELTPLFALGFGQDHLVRNSYRLGLLQDAMAHPDGAFPSTTHAMAPAGSPAHPLRTAFKQNDLRNWVPTSPVLLCGGHDDPTVFFFNATVQQAYWRNAQVPPGMTAVLDVDSTPRRTDPFAAVKQGFALAKANTAAQAVTGGATDGGVSAVLQTYHDTLVPPFCMAAARAFFSAF